MRRIKRWMVGTYALPVMIVSLAGLVGLQARSFDDVSATEARQVIGGSDKCFVAASTLTGCGSWGASYIKFWEWCAWEDNYGVNYDYDGNDGIQGPVICESACGNVCGSYNGYIKCDDFFL